MPSFSNMSMTEGSNETSAGQKQVNQPLILSLYTIDPPSFICFAFLCLLCRLLEKIVN